MIELHSARDMRMTYYTNYCIPAERGCNQTLPLSTWKGRDQTNLMSNMVGLAAQNLLFFFIFVRKT